MKTFRIISGIILGVGLIIFLVLWIIGEVKENKEAKARTEQKEKNDPIPSSGNNQILEEMETAFIGHGDSWETGIINYRFRFRTNGHSIYVSFTSKNGGWTKPFLMEKDFEGDIPIPNDIADKNKQKIRAKVTIGDEEKKPFKIWLYKKR